MPLLDTLVMINAGRGFVLTSQSQDRRRRFLATVCLFAVVLLYAPLGGAAWSLHSAACCTSGQCPIKGHQHKQPPAASEHPMDCGHEMPGLTPCSMSCCQNPDRPALASVVFVLPVPVGAFNSKTSERFAAPLVYLGSPLSIEPLSPPPRFTVAAA